MAITDPESTEPIPIYRPYESTTPLSRSAESNSAGNNNGTVEAKNIATINFVGSFAASKSLAINSICILLNLTPKHSGDLGVATKEPRKGRPAATGRELLRLVNWK